MSGFSVIFSMIIYKYSVKTFTAPNDTSRSLLRVFLWGYYSLLLWNWLTQEILLVFFDLSFLSFLLKRLNQNRALQWGLRCVSTEFRFINQTCSRPYGTVLVIGPFCTEFAVLSVRVLLSILAGWDLYNIRFPTYSRSLISLITIGTSC